MFLLFLPVTTKAQIPQNIISQYSVTDGLAQSTVTCILQDKTGYLWVGTCGGLSRFDGHKFISYKSYPDQQKTISDNFVRWLYEGEEGSIWIGTESGLDKWDIETGEITRQLVDGKGSGKTWYIPFRDDKEWLYFADAIKGISRIGKNTGSIQNLMTGEMFSSLTNVSCSDQKYSWLCSLGQKVLIQYSPESNSAKYHKLPENVSLVFEINTYSDNEILLATDAGLLIFDHVNGKYRNVFQGSDTPVMGICRDNNKNWWIALKDGKILVCSSDLKVLKTITDQDNNPSSRYPRSISRLYSCQNNNIWAGTDGNGLYSINPDLNKFQLFRFADQEIRDANFIRCIASADTSKLLLGTAEGLYELRKNDRSFRRLEIFKNGVRAKPIITGFCRTESGKIIVITDDGIGVTDLKNGCNIKTPYFNNLQSARFSSICKLSGDLYIAGGAGFLALMRYSENDNRFLIIDLIEKNIISLSNTGNDTIFAGLAGGGYQIITADSAKIRIPERNVRDEVNNVRFNNFCRTQDGFTWAATNTGLIKLDRKIRVIRHYSENDGLPDNMVYGIIEDDRENIWFSTAKGIGMLNATTGIISKFSTRDGLQSEEFNSKAYFRDNDGIIYFGGINGLTFFKPEKIKFNQVRPNIVITNFYMSIDKKSIYIKPGEQTIRLKFYQNFFTIDVAALEFSNPVLNEYSFLLKGQDVSWSEPATNNFASYNNLQPGKYEFWVKASNNDKVWSEERKLLTIIISPPFWKSLWFRIMAGTGIALILYFFIHRSFTRRINQKMDSLNRIREIDAIRIKLARDLHDNAGTSLTKISMMADMARMDLNKNIDVSERLESISKSSRSLIDSFSEIIWTTNPQYDNLDSLLTYIRTFIAEFTEGLPIEVRFNIPEFVPQIKIKPDTRHNSFLIVKESVNNAIKHSGASLLLFEALVSDDRFILRISDNGTGFGESGQRAFGNGLSSMKARAASIGACLELIPTSGGTTIELGCPI
jgi:signal transduction histidine kinase/ligand-binding sensor domain-containing protein